MPKIAEIEKRTWLAPHPSIVCMRAVSCIAVKGAVNQSAFSSSAGHIINVDGSCSLAKVGIQEDCGICKTNIATLKIYIATCVRNLNEHTNVPKYLQDIMSVFVSVSINLLRMLALGDSTSLILSGRNDNYSLVCKLFCKCTFTFFHYTTVYNTVWYKVQSNVYNMFAQ